MFSLDVSSITETVTFRKRLMHASFQCNVRFHTNLIPCGVLEKKQENILSCY